MKNVLFTNAMIMFLSECDKDKPMLKISQELNLSYFTIFKLSSMAAKAGIIDIVKHGRRDMFYVKDHSLYNACRMIRQYEEMNKNGNAAKERRKEAGPDSEDKGRKSVSKRLGKHKER